MPLAVQCVKEIGGHCDVAPDPSFLSEIPTQKFCVGRGSIRDTAEIVALLLLSSEEREGVRTQPAPSLPLGWLLPGLGGCWAMSTFISQFSFVV